MNGGYFRDQGSGGFSGPRNPLKFYRDTERGWIAGVCAGIGLYLGIEPKIVRILVALAMFFGLFVPIVIVYVALAMILPPAPKRIFESEREEQFWRSVSASPNRTAADLKHRFRALDRRLAEIEAGLTSDEFDLRRKFRDLRD